VATWTQLGFQRKPCGLLNVDGFYDGLLSFLDHATAERFIRTEHRGIVLSASRPVELIDRLAAFELPVMRKWIDKDQQ